MYQILYHYLEPSLQAYLAREHDLPPDVRESLSYHLQNELAICAAYIPHRLVRSQMEHPEPGRISGAFWQGSLLYADVSGFTAFCDQLSTLGKQGSEEVGAIVNQLFHELAAEVLHYQGDILSGWGDLLKFGGDALTAFFDAETLGDSHAAVATQAALGMQRRMQAFQSVETRAGTFQLCLRVGVHSGRVFAAEVGNTSHMELVITGTEINRVAKAQRIAAPGDVVVSDQTAVMLDGATLRPCDEAGFSQVVAMPALNVPPSPCFAGFNGGDSIDALLLRAQQLAALRPYLLRDLPRRYLDQTVSYIGELRPVSVLFVNFSDFSTLLSLFGNDAQMAATALNEYISRVQDVIHRYGGIMNKVDTHTDGDKFMALFGAPVAHEDDALRAVRCAIELRQTLDEANHEIALLLRLLDIGHQQEELSQIALIHRIGINSGNVFAGRVGSKNRFEYTVMGPAVNLAARLMECADEGEILISPSIRAAVERSIVVEEQAPIEIRGLAEPIIPARVRTEKQMLPFSPEARFERFPLIGRDPELTLLLAEARVALRDSGRMLVMVGDAGVGKTRLVNELVRNLVLSSISEEPGEAVPHFQIYPTACEHLMQSVPYSALRNPLQSILSLSMRWMSIENSNEDEALQMRLENRIEQLAPEFSHFMPLLGDILGIPLPETPLTQALNPEQRHNRIQELIEAILLGSAAQEPMMVVIDDLQWADASSLDLLARLANSIATVPLLIAVTYRSDPAFAEPWINLPTTIRQEVRELSPNHSTAMLEAILHGPPPPEILGLIERTQGNPFFIEELVHALIASKTLIKDDQGQWSMTCSPTEVAVPTSIEGLIMARLDRLEEPHLQLLQMASVIGHRFQYQLIKGIYDEPSELQAGLQILMENDIIVVDPQQRELTYLFRHALLHDIAYESILYARRRLLHRHVAQHIEELNTGHLDDHLALLAHHYLLAEDWDVSFRYHLAAGIQSQNRYANKEALTLFATALEIAARLGHSHAPPTRKQPEQDFFTVLYPAFSTILSVAELYERSGYVSTRIGDYNKALKPFTEALKLVNKLSEERETWSEEGQHFPIPNSELSIVKVRLHRHMATVHEQLANYDAAFDWLERGMAMVNSESQRELARCYLLGSRLYYSQGNFEKSLEWVQQGLSVAETTGNTIDQANALLMMGILWRDRGDFAQSIPALEQARRLLDLMKDATRLSDALKNLGDAYFYTGRWMDSIKCYQKGLQISENVGDILGTAHTSINLANLMLCRGELQLASELFHYSRERFGRIGSVLGLAVTALYQGELLLLEDQPIQALQLFRQSMTDLKRIKVRNYLPRGLRLMAEASLALDDPEQALSHGQQSLELASELGMLVEQAMAYRVLGQIALTGQDTILAERYFDRSKSMLDSMGHQYEQGKVLYWLSKLHCACGHYEESLTALQQAEKIFKDLRAKRDQRIVRELREQMAESIACLSSLEHGTTPTTHTATSS